MLNTSVALVEAVQNVSLTAIQINQVSVLAELLVDDAIVNEEVSVRHFNSSNRNQRIMLDTFQS